MKKTNNPMALSGFIVSVCAAPLFAAAFLSLIGLILIPFMSVVFGEMAGMLAIFGICLSSIGVRHSYRENVGGAGFALAGLLTGTVIITLVLAITALLIVCAVSGTYTALTQLNLAPVVPVP